MGQALRSWMTSVDESMSASDISAVEGGGEPLDSRPNIEGTRSLGARSTQCRANMKVGVNANIVAGTPTRENDPVKAVFAGQSEPGSSSKTASIRTFDSSQMGQNSTPSRYARLAAYMTKGADAKSIVARPGSLDDATLGSLRLREPLKEIFGKNSMLAAASTGAKITRLGLHEQQKELLAAPDVAAEPSTSSSSKGSGKMANAKSGLLGKDAHRDSIQGELIELHSDGNDPVLLTATGRPARKKANYAGHKFEIGRHFARSSKIARKREFKGNL